MRSRDRTPLAWIIEDHAPIFWVVVVGALLLTALICVRPYMARTHPICVESEEGGFCGQLPHAQDQRLKTPQPKPLRP
jgi:hypothetical protein